MASDAAQPAPMLVLTPYLRGYLAAEAAPVMRLGPRLLTNLPRSPYPPTSASFRPWFEGVWDSVRDRR